MKTWLIWTLVAVAIIVVVYFLMKAKDKTVVKPDGTVVNGLGAQTSREVRPIGSHINPEGKLCPKGFTKVGEYCVSDK
jgi:hypothetical protein